MNVWFGLLAWLAIAAVAAAVGAVASIDAGDLYAQLTRPAWAPPASWFGPVWTTLYALMGISAWLVWRARGLAAARPALTLFLVQLAVNALWSWLFFVWRLGAASFVEVVLLWCLVTATIVAFARVSKLAAILLLPYWAWVTFASALTYTVWRLNPALLG